MENRKMKIKQNDKRKILTQLLKPVAAIAAALLVGAVLILYAGANPVTAYQSLLAGAFGSFYNFTEVLVKASPLWLAGLGVALSFKAGIFNVGAEGQIMMGALATAWIGVVLGNLPMIILLPVTMQMCIRDRFLPFQIFLGFWTDPLTLAGLETSVPSFLPLD